MENELQKTWIIIKIGNREYAVNSAYIRAVTELKHQWFEAESSLQYVKGNYTVFGVTMPIIDGYKLAREKSLDESKLDFSKRYNEFKLSYMSWLDTLNWQSMSWDEASHNEYLKLVAEISDWIDNNQKINDTYGDKLLQRLNSHISINLTRGNKLLSDRHDKKLSLAQAEGILEEIKRDSDRHIFDAIDNLVEYYTSKMSEMCIIVNVKDKNFGISIDAVKMVSDSHDKMSKINKTVLSAGVLTINGVEYNILNLTKISKII